ncbi:hypothetical protein pb186bvf_013474 [Paramecium bursaria]
MDLNLRQEYFPKIICFVCDVDIPNRKRMYCTVCHVILCAEHKDALKRNCQHIFIEYFQSCFGCGIIMKQKIEQIDDQQPFEETEDHLCFKETLKILLSNNNQQNIQQAKDQYLESVNKIIQQQPTVHRIKKAQELFLGKPQKKVKIQEQIIEQKQNQQKEQNEQD